MTDNEVLRFWRNVALKGLFLFLIVDLVLAAWDPLPALGRISAYNRLLPGRVRLPYGDGPQQSYNLSLYSIDAMFASHEVSAGPKPPDEFRVLLIGDSSTWGFLLQPEETLAVQINAAGYWLDDGRRVRAFNLGYPVMSLTKDLLLLDYAMRYEPDLIVWSFTLESFPKNKQLYPPLLQNNVPAVKNLLQTYGLQLEEASSLVEADFWDRTLIGRRRLLADLLRLQFYGVLWAATGIDHHIPETYTAVMEDLPADNTFHDLQPPQLQRDQLALEVLLAGVRAAGDTPILFVNEPMFISQGENSGIRYNFYYPRWAYDDYRQILQAESQANGWDYLDLWNAIPAHEFTNSAVHRSPAGEAQFARLLADRIIEMANESH